MSGRVELSVPGVVERASQSRVRPTVRRASRVLVAAGILGVVGQLLFFEVAIGVNFPIAIALVVAGGWLLRGDRRPRLIDLWLGPAAIVFAAFAAVRSDPTIVALDVLAALALAAGALASFGGRRVVSRSFGGLVELAASAFGWGATGAIPAIADARHALPSGRAARRRAAFLPILRGIAIAVPLLLVFVALFASADAVFARVVENAFAFDQRLDELIWRSVTAAGLAWVAAGGLAFAATRSGGDAVSAPSLRWRLGTPELLTALVALNALFLVFVGLQGAYLFGGLDTLAASGLTYADYARRGFLELVVVAVLAGGIVVAADRVARDRSRAVVAACVSLAVLTSVVLVSAALRMRLYQEAYGWTELRFYVLGTIVLLGIGLVSLVVALVVDRVRWIGHIVIVTGLVIGLVLSTVGPVRFITEQNVVRSLNPGLVPSNGSSGLDVRYAAGLGDDAIPALLEALPSLEPQDARYLGAELAARHASLQDDWALNAWQAWNLGRSTARDTLEQAEAAGTIP